MQRREFVKYLTAGTAGQFILPALRAQAAITPLNVVIIGGGMAGATAAKYLRVWARKLAIDAYVSVTIIDMNARYTSNIMSNMVLTGERTLDSLKYSYANLGTKYGVKFIQATVSSVDLANGWAYGKTPSSGSNILLNATPFNKLILATGVDFDYGEVSLTDTLYTNHYDAIPHAWQAGAQTTLLRNQLVNMKAGNHVAITIPPSPYRCPPGPYERACVIADWLRVKKPGSRLYLYDPKQTPDGRPPVEPNNFGNAFANIHKNLVYVQNAKLMSVSTSLSGTAKMKTLSFVPNVAQATGPNSKALVANTSVTVEVANVIPKMMAGALARSVLLPAGGLDPAEKRWAMVDEKTYKSPVSKVYVIGDGIKSANQPKAGHIGNQQAKVCADAILREFSSVALYDAPVTNSACFTPVTTSLNTQYGAMASWLTATFRYGLDGDGSYRMLPVSTNIESPGAASKDNFESMGKWFTSLMQDVYS
jgi:thioredoxin reductase